MTTRRPKLYQYKYPHPAVAADCVVFGWDGRRLQLLLIERGGQPFQGCWAFPGGFVNIDEDLDAGARRELAEETGLRPRLLKQFQAFGDPERDPRERVIGVAYFSVVNLHAQQPRASSDARHVQWFPLHRLPKLAFDHAHVLRCAREKLREHAALYPVGLEALPETFSARELGAFYGELLGAKIPPGRLLGGLARLGLVQPAGAKRLPAAAFFRFNRSAYRRLERKGLGFKAFASLA